MRFVALASLVLAACGHPEGGSFNLARIDQNFVEIDGARAPVTFRVVGRTVAALHWELIGPGAIDFPISDVVVYTPPAEAGEAKLQLLSGDFVRSTALIRIK